MKMRKISMLFAAVGMAAALCLAGCGSSSDSSDAATGDDETVEAAADETADETTDETDDADTGSDALGATGYVFTLDGVTFGVDDDSEAVVAALGDYDSVYEAESCAGQGTAHIYTYGSVQIETYPADDGVDRIAFITLKDDTVSTPEGADLSMTKDDVEAIYGDPSSEDTGLIYEKDGMKLEFIFDEDDMSSIEYVSPVAG